MLRTCILLLVLSTSAAAAQDAHNSTPAPTLRSMLLQQLHASHDTAEWFTPVNTAVAGLSAEQARWIPKDHDGRIDPAVNHSVGMLAAHLVFWNERVLHDLRGEPKPGFDGNNNETFNEFDPATWAGTVRRLDAVMRNIEDFTQHASDAQLAKNAETLSHVSTHNAYHTGQMMYVRKLQGAWDASKAVK